MYDRLKDNLFEDSDLAVNRHIPLRICTVDEILNFGVDDIGVSYFTTFVTIMKYNV